MDTAKAEQKKEKVLAGVYGSSMGASVTAIAIVAAMEVFMLGYSVVNAPMYGDLLWRYRAFYICLLLAALVYLGLNAYAKRDIEHRYKVLNVANPVYACFFFAWALGITFFDAMHWGTVDPMVFMTFSLVVPLAFFVLPLMYTAIVIVADVFIIYLAVTISGSLAPITNLSIFCIFQVVLSFNFLRLRMRLAERILEEQENADIDALTGFLNRRVYDRDVRKLAAESPHIDLVYISIDLNGLKEANDLYGHEAGDKLLVGATDCMRQCFGKKGVMYRIGGDEFVILAHVSGAELKDLVADYENRVRLWDNDGGPTLSTAFGYACYSEYSDEGIVELARVADRRMYADKARYYQTSGRDRRRRMDAKEPTTAS